MTATMQIDEFNNSVEKKVSPLGWRDRIILDAFDSDGLVELWMERAYRDFCDRVKDQAYPCFFGTTAERRGEMFYAFVQASNIFQLAGKMREFVRRGRIAQCNRYNLAVFFRPDGIRDHKQFGRRFWDILQYLHMADTRPDPGQPSDAEWEFTFEGCQMFVVASSPTYLKRRSRNLGDGMVILFQPRSVFVDIVTNEAISSAARGEVRDRLRRWDEIPAHPDLGVYGDPKNLEWKQYCLPDDNEPMVGECPFRSRSETAL